MCILNLTDSIAQKAQKMVTKAIGNTTKIRTRVRLYILADIILLCIQQTPNAKLKQNELF